MSKKTIYYIIGGIAILSIGYYLMNKGKKPSTQNNDTDDNSMALDSMTLDKKKVEVKLGEKVGSKLSARVVQPQDKKKLTPEELETLLQKGCGKKPRLKRNKVKYEECRSNLTAKLKGEGLVAFDGSYNTGFYSNFENNLDLDL